MPPRPSAAGHAQQRFVLRPLGVRRHDGGRAAACRAPARAGPVGAYGLARDPGSGPLRLDRGPQWPEPRPAPASTAPARLRGRSAAANPARSGDEGGTAMGVLESRDYQAARERLKGNPVIAMMAAGVVTVPLAELAHEDGTPRSHLMNQANRAFDDAEARNAGNPAYKPYPQDAHRHLGLIAEAVLAERAAMREAVASAMAPPGTDPESADVTSIIERMRAGESAVAIARETGAIREPSSCQSEGEVPDELRKDPNQPTDRPVRRRQAAR